MIPVDAGCFAEKGTASAVTFRIYDGSYGFWPFVL